MASVALASAAPPRELWNAFPLDQRTTTPEAPAIGVAPASSQVAPEPAREQPFPWLVLVGAVAGVAALSGTLIAVGHRLRRPRPQVPEPQVDDDAAFRAYVASLVGPVGAEVQARPADRRGRRDRSTPAQAELAYLAAEYLEIIAAGSPRPVLDLAARLGWSPGKTQKKLARARAEGLLTSLGRGRAGGELTDEALRALSNLSGQRGSDAVQRPRLRVADPLLDQPSAPPPETPLGDPLVDPTRDQMRDRRRLGS